MRIVRRIVASALFVSAAVWLGNTVRAAETATVDLAVFKVIPEDALAVVIVNHLDKVDEQIGKLAKGIQVPVPPILSQLKLRAGVQEGLDDHGSAAIVLMPGEEGSHPVTVAIVPVTDYKKFVAQLEPDDASAEITKVTVTGESSLVGKKDSFAILTDTGHKDLLKKILDSSRPITPVIGGLSGWIGEHELSFVATPTGVKHGTAAARKGLAEIKTALANANDETTKSLGGIFDAYDSMLASAEKELSSVGVGVHVDNDGGLHIDTRALFVPNGDWAASGKEIGHSQGTQLACLPSGSFMIAFGGAMPGSFSKNLLNMSIEMMNRMSKAAGGKEMTAEQAKQLNELIQKAMADVRSMSMVMGPPKPGDSFYSNLVGAMKVKDSKKYMADYEKMMAAMQDLFRNSQLESFMPKEAKKIKIGDLDGLELTMDMSKMIANVPNAPGAKQMLQMLFGPEGKLNVYVAAIDDTTIAISYVSSDNIARVAAACKNPQTGLAADPDITQTAMLLPHGAQWVGYLSPKGFIEFIGTAMMAMAPPGGGGAMPRLPPFPQTPPIGFGAELSGRGLDLNVVVPGAALKGVGTYVMQMKQRFAPGNPPPIR